MALKSKICLLLSLYALTACAKQESMPKLIDRVFSVAKEQCVMMEGQLTDRTLPRTLSTDGKLVTSGWYWWCSGFYPGSLWYVYEYTKDEKVKDMAIKNTLKLDSVQYVTKHHDIGFQLNCSYGNALRLTGNKEYEKVLYQGAQTLARRFSPVTGVIRSWDFVRKGRHWKYPVIIDNMMNLELLLSMSKAFDNDSLKEIACSHANRTIQNHFREDYTTYHLVDYDPETGAVRSQETVQGYADSSAWARGQAWALYGYTMMFRMTGYQSYLIQARHVADMLLKRLPSDGIPYWDFNAPGGKDCLRDASAGAVMASAFVELSNYVPSGEAKSKYLAMAEKQIRTLASDKYLAKPGTNGGFILKHSVGSYPDKSEVDVPLTYADYYFLEALLRYKQVLTQN